MKTVIIGAGLGGLSAANALLRAGHEVEVYERAPELREVGAGIAIWGNAAGALRSIGIAEKILARGERMQTAEFLLSSGRRLSTTPAAEFEKAGGLGIALVHRAELLEELARPLPPGCVRLERTYSRYEADPAGGPVRVHFEDGSIATAEALIAADGIHSRARAQMLADGPPLAAGYAVWRGIARVADTYLVPPGYAGEIWGPRGARFGVTRIGAGRVYWWASLNSPPSPGAEGTIDESARRRLLATHGRFCLPVPRLIEMTDPAHIIRNDIYDRRPTRRWSDGRVLLIGDAAHPTTPNLGQGGCMAMEDGATLGPMLEGAGADDPRDIERRLSDFVARRYTKTARTVRDSHWFGVVGQWENPVLCWGRNAVMVLLARALLSRTHRRIGRFEV